MKTNPYFIPAILLILLLAACNQLPSTDLASESKVVAWFDAPLPGSVNFPPNPCNIVMHGTSPNGVSLFELNISGRDTQLVPVLNTSETLSLMTMNCGFNTPGRYELNLRVQDTQGTWSNYASTSLVISNENAATTPALIESLPAKPVLTSTPTTLLIPTYSLSATPEPYAYVSLETVSTDLLFVGNNDCGPQDITFTASGIDSRGIYELILFYRFQSGTTTEWEGVHMYPIGNDLFQSTLDLTELFGNSIPFDQATLQYYVTILNNNSEYSAQTDVFSNVSINACAAATPPCSSYTDPRTCAAQGCVWNTLPSMGPPITVCDAP